MSALHARLVAVPPVIPHARPCLGAEEEAAALRVLRSGRLAPGPETAHLEKLLARLTESADAVSVASGTLALTLALRALGIRWRDQIAVPSFASAALLHVIRAVGATALVCDIDPSSLAILPEEVERRATRRLRAVIVVHPYGRSVEIEPFRSRGLLVVEDCSQAIGATIGGRPVGSQGDAAVLSFAPDEMITCGGPGGALVSPQPTLVPSVRDLASHEGRSIDRVRVNGLMGDLHAAIATVQVERLKEFIARRAAIAARYDRMMRGAGGAPPEAESGRAPVFSRYLVPVRDPDGALRFLQRQGILARRPVQQPLHRLLGLRSRFPATEAAHARMISLPIYPTLDDAAVERIVDAVSELIDPGPVV
jgi:dTDP-4-amino-4,6-dideoxygalactose transaminase